MPRGRVRVPEGMEELLVSDWERVLSETMLAQEDRKIAKLYIIEKMPQIDVATEMNYDRSTVSRRMGKILKEARRVAERLGYLA